MSRVVTAPGPGRALFLGVAFLFAAGVARADALPLVVFGDSWSDGGNVYAATGGAVPPAPYSAGHYSNGQVWAEKLAAQLGAPALTPSALGGTNYAFGGAESGTGTSTVGTPNLGSQVNSYLAGNTPASGQLFVVWAGANDFMLGGQTNPGVVVDNVINALKALASAGADKFLVPNLPPLGDSPLFAGTSYADPLNALSGGYNALLDQKLDQLAGDLDVSITKLDIEGLFDDILGDPAGFGFTDVTRPALDPATGQVATDPNKHLYWDTVHPTTAGHDAIAARALAALNAPPSAQAPEPATIVSLGVGLSGLGALAGFRRRRAA